MAYSLENKAKQVSYTRYILGGIVISCYSIEDSGALRRQGMGMQPKEFLHQFVNTMRYNKIY